MACVTKLPDPEKIVSEASALQRAAALEEYGEDENKIYVNAGLEAVMTIDLGWPMFFETKGGYIAMDKQGNPITGLQMIPTTYSQQNEFVADVGIDTVADDLPGELLDINLEFRMIQGVVPDDYDGEEEYPETAHLIVTINKSSTIEDEEREGGYSAASECKLMHSRRNVSRAPM